MEVMHLHYHQVMIENEDESSLTDRYQTTVPARIRKALGLGKKDKLQWLLDDSGGVRISKKGPDDHEDPILEKWLDFLAKDIEENPQNLVPLDAKLYEDIVAELSGERGKGIEGLPPTLEELLEELRKR